jgi:predicted dehydrogenase
MHGIGVIGLGVMGRRFIESLRANPDFRIVAAYDPASVDLDVPRARSIQELLDDPSIDCIYIATPPVTHDTFVQAAAGAGKAIFCEKPLTVSSVTAGACLEAIGRAGVPAAVNFPLATARAAVRLKELVQGGDLGNDLSAHVQVRFRTWPRGWQQGAVGWLAGPEQGGFTREVVSHFVFLALRLFGPATLLERNVEWSIRRSETRMQAVLQFADCRLIIDGAVEGEIDDSNRLEVKGSKGSAVMSDWYRLRHGNEEIEPVRADASQIKELARLLSGRPNRLATFHEAAAVVDIVEGILSR